MSPRIAAVASFFVAMLGSVPTVNGWEENQTLERFAGEDARSRSRTSVRRITEDDSAAISKLIDDINAAARTNKQRMLSIITINTDVAGSTLEQEKAKYGLSFGEVYVAHSLALATRTKFDTIVKLEKSGKTWPQIAREHNVTLKGSRELIRQMKEKK